MSRVANELKEFVSNFNEPRVILVYDRFKKNEQINGFENPIANFLYYFLLDKGHAIYVSEAIGNKNLVNKLYSKIPDRLEIISKDLSLFTDKFVIRHMGRKSKNYPNGIWLNQGKHELPLDLNFEN